MDSDCDFSPTEEKMGRTENQTRKGIVPSYSMNGAFDTRI